MAQAPVGETKQGGNKRKQWCTLPEREPPEFGESLRETRSVEREYGEGERWPRALRRPNEGFAAKGHVNYWSTFGSPAWKTPLLKTMVSP